MERYFDRPEAAGEPSASFRPSPMLTRLTGTSLRNPVGGAKLLRLDAADPHLPTPAPIVEAAHHALLEGYTRYTDRTGDPQLREALAAELSCTAAEPYSFEQILVTHGANGALAAAILATVGPGDRVVLPDPTYSLYADLVAMAGAEPVLVPSEADGSLDLDALAPRVHGARLLVLCHPSNPTGHVYSESELVALAQVLEPEPTMVLVDEAYAAFVHAGRMFTTSPSVPTLRPRLLYCQTFSKRFAMTGWRIGFLAGPAAVVSAAARIHRTLLGPVNSAVQRAALFALRNPQLAEPIRATYAEHRTLAVDRLTAAGHDGFVPPAGGLFVHLRFSGPLSSVEAARRLREVQGVAVRPGREFGPAGEGHLRISFAVAEEDLARGLDLLVEGLSSL